MPKIMLVEDDNNLREIYQARLQAEGYEVVAAKDGEEALAIAVKEKPDLFIADVMMPKISGFDMLDILRSTPETKNAKVIMMTALSQAEDKSRAAKLGADRYMVKSQVTLEDVVAAAREVLGGTAPSAGSETASTNNIGENSMDENNTNPAPAAPAPADDSQAPVVPAADQQAQPAAEQTDQVETQIQDFISSQQSNVAGAAPAPDDGAAAPMPAPAPDPTAVPDTSEQLIPDISPDAGQAPAPVDNTMAPADDTSAATGSAVQDGVVQPLSGTDDTSVAPAADNPVPGTTVEPSADGSQDQNPPVLS